MNAKIKQLTRWFREALKPDPILTVSQWADKKRILSSKASSETGPWRTDRTPYAREIMDALSITHPAKKVVFKKASQIGGTEIGNNFIGYVIDEVPGPIMLVLPNIASADRNVAMRLDPMIDETPTLRQKVSARKSRDTKNTKDFKDFDGGVLVIATAQSAAALKSVPCRFTMLDEIDEYPASVEGQGDPISLVDARSRNFSRRKSFRLSTPTMKGHSRIDDEFEASDQRYYHVPCPHCARLQKLEFEQLHWERGKPETVVYVCKHCGVEIPERHKTKMLRDEQMGGKAKWIAENPGHEVPGFFINSLYSPIGWLSWKEIAADYDKARDQIEKEKKEELMIVFWNTILGKSYESRLSEAPEWKILYHRREQYEIGSVPAKALFLTMGVDVQKDRLEAEVVGWGENKESWSIEYLIFRGDTSKPEVWKELEASFVTTYRRAIDGADLSIRMVCVDSGFNTQHVYNFCRRFPVNRVVPIKGVESLSVAIGFPKAVDLRVDGKRAKRRAVKVWAVGVTVLKSELYGFLKIDPPIGDEPVSPGFCHFPEYSEEFFKQITAEKIVWRKNKRGFPVAEFVKDRERNEVLDCRVYARAAASMVGLDRFKAHDFAKFRVATIEKPKINDKTENSSNDSAVQAAPPPQPTTPRPAPRPRRPKAPRPSSIW